MPSGANIYFRRPTDGKIFECISDLSITELRALDTVDVDKELWAIDDVRLCLFKGRSEHYITQKILVLLGPINLDNYHWASGDKLTGKETNVVGGNVKPGQIKLPDFFDDDFLDDMPKLKL